MAREFRGVWIATVDNIDWPSKPGLSTAQQQAELVAIFDRAAALRLNAVIFQVRASCDAFYQSKYEPWSEFLNGQMGRPPKPFYDPLEFAVTEAHRRGLELHAWFNPYRARHYKEKGPAAEEHVSKARPELVKHYGKYLWLDPGDRAVQDYSLTVIRDVLRRYDLDGVHIDDYFYPYKEKDTTGRVLPFPDTQSRQRYVDAGGKLGQDDWRRSRVDQFVQRLYKMVKAEKPWVKFGVSPFGIWRPGHPPQIQGLDAYTELYADARKWLVNGWVDYFAPQLYWRTNRPAQSYPVLLKWWAAQNKQRRHLWPGNNLTAAGTGQWPVEEITHQVRLTRAQAGAGGNILYSAKNLALYPVSEGLRWGVYWRPALVPASPWLGRTPPGTPKLLVRKDGSSGERQLAWTPAGGKQPWLWVVQFQVGGEWRAEVLPGWRTTRPLNATPSAAGATVAAVSAVDRLGNQGKPAVVTVGAG
ncbi:MAG TPA: family 10 glycosylhydrolase [Armatimonadota bacterium]|nr:family 10 glycosylhydrolase [Armatimonadota bacterium]